MPKIRERQIQFPHYHIPRPLVIPYGIFIGSILISVHHLLISDVLNNPDIPSSQPEPTNAKRCQREIESKSSKSVLKCGVHRESDAPLRVLTCPKNFLRNVGHSRLLPNHIYQLAVRWGVIAERCNWRGLEGVS